MSPAELFPLGTICLSRRCLGVLGDAGIHPLDLIRRHESGDWGGVDPIGWRQNDRAVMGADLPVVSMHPLGQGLDLWVITNRGRTRILLPDEY